VIELGLAVLVVLVLGLAVELVLIAISIYPLTPFIFLE
jgi:hypothetical protein